MQKGSKNSSGEKAAQVSACLLCEPITTLSRFVSSSSPPLSSPPPPRRPDKISLQHEMNHLRKRLQELDDLCSSLPSTSGSNAEEGESDAQNFLNALPASQRKRTQAVSVQQRYSVSEVADSLRGWIGPYEVEGSSANIDWPGSSRVVASDGKNYMRGEQTTHKTWLFDLVHPYWANPVNFQSRIELSRHARTLLPSTIIIEELIDTYFYRCNHLVSNFIFEPRFRRLAAVSYKSNLTTEEILTSPLYIDPCCWVMLFMILSIALCFYPSETSNPTPAFHAVNSFRSSEGQAWSERWHEFSRRCLVVGECLELTSLPAVQSATLMCFRAREPEGWIRGLQNVVIFSALRMGYHRLGNDPLPEHLRVEDRARKEMITRLWSYLTIRDWFTLASHRHNVIQPWQFSTCAPLQISDLEILAGKRQSHPASEFSEMSYPLAMHSLSRIAREIGEMQTGLGAGRSLSTESQDRLTESLIKWINNLPKFYKPSAKTTKPVIAFIQRWRIIAQVFHQILKVHNGDLTRRSTRQALLPLAIALLEMYPMVIGMCPVSRASWSNPIHLVSACLVIGLDLMDARERYDEHPYDTSGPRRLKMRILLSRGVESLSAISEVGTRIAQLLLEHEEQRHHSLVSMNEAQGRPINFKQLYDNILDEAFSRCQRPLGAASVFTLPAKGHDAVMPALSTASDGSWRCDIVPQDSWQRAHRNARMALNGHQADVSESSSESDIDLLLQVAAASSRNLQFGSGGEAGLGDGPRTQHHGADGSKDVSLVADFSAPLHENVADMTAPPLLAPAVGPLNPLHTPPDGSRNPDQTAQPLPANHSRHHSSLSKSEGLVFSPLRLNSDGPFPESETGINGSRSPFEAPGLPYQPHCGLPCQNSAHHTNYQQPLLPPPSPLASYEDNVLANSAMGIHGPSQGHVQILPDIMNPQMSSAPFHHYRRPPAPHS